MKLQLELHGLEKMPGPILSSDLNATIENFIQQLKCRGGGGSMAIAMKTTEILRSVISQQRLPSSGSPVPFIEAVKSVGLRLIAANSLELGIGNIVRRVLHIIRDEEANLEKEGILGSPPSGGGMEDEAMDLLGRLQPSPAAVAAANRSVLRAPSLTNLLEQVVAPQKPHSQDLASVSDSDVSSKRDVAEKGPGWHLKHNVVDAVNELLEEIKSFHGLIAEQALEHIHQNEVIMTAGYSKTVFNFLRKAGKSRAFQAIIVAGHQSKGQKFAVDLMRSQARDKEERSAKVSDAHGTPRGIQTNVVPDSNVPALMCRVNMVIVGALAVMANGGVIVPAGVAMIAMTAKRFRVPFVVLAGLHKLCPAYPHDPKALVNHMQSPSNCLDLGEFNEFLDSAHGEIQFETKSPAYDYIPPEHITFFLTDTGGHNPSYVYRLISEYYSPEDVTL